jgi:putative FmdB family regulatory protein
MMPTYTYKCPECDSQFERVLQLAEHDAPQGCPDCGQGPAKRIIAGSVGFVLRGDGWAGKNNKVKGQMSRRRQRLAGKEHEQKMDGPGMRLAPNVNGERVDSWSDAKKLAKSKGKDTSSYDANVRKERQEGRR